MSRKEDLQDSIYTLRKEGPKIVQNLAVHEYKSFKSKLDNIEVCCKSQTELNVKNLPDLEPREYVWQHLNDAYVNDTKQRIDQLLAYKKIMKNS